MSAIDNEIDRFYGRMVRMRRRIDDFSKRMKDYEKKRMSFPAWVTKDGIHIQVYEIEDSHLCRLISFVQRKDPNNKTNWVEVFKAERWCRICKFNMPIWKAELARMEEVSDMCL